MDPWEWQTNLWQEGTPNVRGEGRYRAADLAETMLASRKVLAPMAVLDAVAVVVVPPVS